MRPLPLLGCLLVLGLLVGCAVTVQGGPGTGSDAASNDVTIPVDGGIVDDTGTPLPFDGGIPRQDVFVSDGVVMRPDAPLLPRDVSASGDRPSVGFSFVGRWRAVAMEFTDDEGRARRILDTPTNVSQPGGPPFTARINGTLLVEPRRLVYGVAFLVQEHIQGSPDDGSGGGLNAGGAALAGTLDDTTGVFRFAPGDEGAVRLQARPDGTVAIVSQTDGNATVFARDVFPVRLSSVQGRGIVQRPAFARGDSIHAALFWDVSGTGHSEFLTAPLRFGPEDFVYFNVPMLPLPPPSVRGRVRATPVAVAYPSAYVDRDNNNVHTAADGPRAAPTVAIAWRGDGPPGDLAGTAFEDLMPGYSFAVLGQSYPSGGLHLVPLDNLHPIAPDVPYRDMSRPLPIAGDLPDLVP